MLMLIFLKYVKTPIVTCLAWAFTFVKTHQFVGKLGLNLQTVLILIRNYTFFDIISDQINLALSLYLSANIVVVGDFNHTEWLSSSVSDSASVMAHNFCLSQSITQIVNFATCFPDNLNHLPSLLTYVLFLIIVSDQKQDSGLISLKLFSHSSLSSESPYHQTSYNYLKAEWEPFLHFFHYGPWVKSFRLPADKCASYVTSWIQAGMESFTPSQGFQIKPHSSPWFSSHCAASISNCNHYFHNYPQNNSLENRRLFTIARDCCQKAPETSGESLTVSIISANFYSSTFTRFRLITLLKDKAELFAKNSFSSVDSTNHILPDIADKQVDPLLDICITPASVSKVISCLDPSTACGPDNVPVIVLQKCSPELSSILSKLFNKCLSESCFPACWKEASVIPIFKNSGERFDLSSYCPISLFPIISKVF
ncbi:uncharacterized protein LOC136095628 [Hydra vulgaris]|uniref:uncharacterized protein LOC136095628 n=1 Tax=Hydra vulgaris TaxID=6087 RepID=UPI0032EA1405